MATTNRSASARELEGQVNGVSAPRTAKPPLPDAEWQRRAQAAIRLLDEWSTGSEEDQREQQETWEFLKRALDEDRFSTRKLFP